MIGVEQTEKIYRIITLIAMLTVAIMSIIGIITNIIIIVVNFNVYAVLKLYLALLGVTIILLYISKNRAFSWVSMIFFFPQIIVIVKRTFQKVHFFVEQPIFDLSVGLRFGFDLIWAKGLDQYDVMTFNIIAIVGLFISFKTYGRLLRDVDVFIDWKRFMCKRRT